MKGKIGLPEPQRTGFDRYNFMWCSKCGAPTWVEKPAGVVITGETLHLAKPSGPTCDCNVGWGGARPNKVFAAKQPAGWFIRKLADVD